MTRHQQPDLFGNAEPAPSNPLLDLVVTLPDVCNQCGAAEAVIGAGRGPHLASLRCRACQIHRGWVGQQTYKFLAEIVAKFGRPETPIAIRRARDIGFINSPDLTILPPPRGGETDDRKPLAIDPVEVEAESHGENKCR